jgi:LAGLIDADG DNA endonuclease family
MAMGSTLGYKASYFISMFTGVLSYHLGVIVGLLLSDASIQTGSKYVTTARLVLTQSLKHFQYLWFVWTILSPYCQSLPHLVKTKLNGKVYLSVAFKTHAYASLAIIYKMFIVNGVKVVPNNIFNLLNEVALAHWIMGDGAKTTSRGLLLCTDSFTLQDVVKLMNVLRIKWNISSNLVFYNKLPRIYIPKGEMNKVRDSVSLHMHRSFNYKLYSL